ncbi:MAG: TonB-dependent receptor domain-containing protein, partial [Sphingomonadaceae bacterium]
DDLTARDTSERKRISLDWTWQGDGAIDYASLAAYWQQGKDVQFTDEDRSPVSATPRPDRERLNTFENRVFGLAAEARSDFSTGGIGHRLNFGGDISWTRQKGLRDGVEPPALETFPARAFPVTDFMLGGVFAGDEISLIGGGLVLYPALRFDFYDLDPKNDPLLPGFMAKGQNDSRLSPKIGAVAKLGGSVRLFANYAQGFRAPTPSQVNNFFENLAFGYTSAPNPDLGPERSESWEGGLRLNTRNVGVSVTAFSADYKDFIDQQVVSGSFTPMDPAVYQWVNVGRVKVKGLEGAADFRSEAGFTGRMAIAYAKGDEHLPGGGKAPLASIDPLSLVIGLGYRDPGNRFGGELIVTHNARKSADRADGVCTATCYRPDAFTILDLTAFWRPVKPLTLRAGVFNITDEKYAYWSDVRGLSAASSVTDAYTRPGRNASVSLSYAF